MNELEKKEYFKKYFNDINRICRICSTIGIILLLAAPFALSISLNTMPDMPAFIKGYLQIAIIYIPVNIVEFLVYTPMIGAGASYISFITGNCTNMKIPCVINARDIVGAKQGTPENEIVSTISATVSALTTTVILAVGVILLVPLTPVLKSPTLQPAFNYVVPALFGALAAKFFKQGKELVALPLIIMIAIYVIFPSMIANVGVLMVVSALISLAQAYLLFKKGKKEKEEMIND